MSVLLAVDPGIRGTGAAVFSGGALSWADYVISPFKSGDRAAEAAAMARAVYDRVRQGPVVTEISVEWPRVYATSIRMGRSKGDPNDLLALAGVDAAIATMFSFAKATTSYAPSEWKGQMTKEACHARVYSRLGTVEAALVRASAERIGARAHNMLDAVGIGLHHLGRLARHRVIPA